MRYITIDPGLSGTGYAVWDDLTLIICGTIYPVKEQSWIQNVRNLSIDISKLAKGCKKCYCEYPEIQSSGSGRASAVKGDLFKLSALIGAFVFVCLGNGIEFIPVKVSAWKGQLPKSVTKARVIEHFGKVACQNIKASHVYDALALGLWVQDGKDKISKKIRKMR